MAQAGAQVLEWTGTTSRDTLWEKLSQNKKVYPTISPNMQTIDPPNDWLDDMLVALSRPSGPYTYENAEDYLDTEPVELYNGWLVREEMSDFNTKGLEGSFYDNLSSTARQLGFGKVLPDQMECLLKNGNVVKPDLSMISRTRRRQQVIPQGPNDRPTLMGSPEFVVEVRSPSNRRTQEAIKRKQYFENGAEVIWDVDEDNQIIYVYRAETPEVATAYSGEDEIDCEPFLPGWHRKVSDLFLEEASVEIIFKEVVDTFFDKGEKIGREEGEKLGERRGKQIGREEGEKAGEQRSKQDMLIRLLQARFPDTSEPILETIQGTDDIAQLDNWFNQALTAQSLDELSL